MAVDIKVEIQVKGKKISPFSSLTIHQLFNDHHYFELRFGSDVIEDEYALLINKSKDYLGEEITISFSAGSGPENTFKGIVTEVSMGNDTNKSEVLLKGYSPTILLDNGDHKASFKDIGLSQIVKAATSSVPDNVLATTVSPAYKSSIPFTVQYRESNFCFIRRLAAEYGEWFFYDGSHFYFGKPSGPANIKLTYPTDITALQLDVKVAPLNFEHKAYYSKDDKRFTSSSSGKNVSGLDSFGKLAQSVSNKLYSKPVNSLSVRPAQTQKDLDDQITFHKSSLAAEMVRLRASSELPGIKVGGSVTVSGAKLDDSSEDFGKYVVTAVVHSFDGYGNYSNSFEAIPASLDIMPNPYTQKPLAEPQLGVIKSTDDPDKLGKVTVQLMWQDDGTTTPFIRVMMPHAGLRDSDKKNRGLFFTPEVEDYVIVGFHQSDPARPFVMGSVPHGKAINTSMNSDNNAKAIRTRSGNTIYFYDKESSQEQEIRIETDEKNYISIHVPNGKGAIKVYSTDTIELKSETSITVTSKDIAIKASNNIDIEASNNITIKASNNVDMEGSNNATIKAGQKASLSGMQVAAEGSQSFEAKGMQVNIEGTTATAVKSSVQLDLQGGAMATLKGGIVQIN